MLGAHVASQEPKGFLGSAPATSEGALGKVDQVHRGLLGGPGSAKVRQGFNFDGKTNVILTFSFFVPRGSRERVRRPPRRSLERGRGPKRRPRGAQNDRSIFFWALGEAQIGTSVEKVAFGK